MDETLDSRRRLPLAGAHNVRDLGGYRTRSGDITRWGRFLRASSMHLLTDDDLGVLSEACEPLIAFADESLGSAFMTGEGMPPMDVWTLETVGDCVMLDADDDLIADGFGTASEPCAWTVQVGMPPGPAFEASFWASRKLGSP
mgnify:CR=1 FL=1